jgi:hypothetical protein
VPAVAYHAPIAERERPTFQGLREAGAAEDDLDDVERLLESTSPRARFTSPSPTRRSSTCAPVVAATRWVTPLSPAEWQLIFDGATVSLSPSVGNWEFLCRSHYGIRRNRVQWAPSWSKARIEAGQSADQRELDAYFTDQGADAPPGTAESKA